MDFVFNGEGGGGDIKLSILNLRTFPNILLVKEGHVRYIMHSIYYKSRRDLVHKRVQEVFLWCTFLEIAFWNYSTTELKGNSFKSDFYFLNATTCTTMNEQTFQT